MTRQSDPDVSAVQAEVRRLAHSQQTIDKFWATELAVDQHGWMTLTSLVRGGPSTPTELARALGISTAAMSLVLQRLEVAGHTTRALHPMDRRKIVVTATEKTVQRIYGLVAPVIQGLAAITLQLNPDERHTVASFLGDLNDLYLHCAATDLPDTDGTPPRP